MEERERLRREGLLSTTSAPVEPIYVEGEILPGEGEVVVEDGGVLDASDLTDEEKAQIAEAVAPLVGEEVEVQVEGEPQVEVEGSDDAEPDVSAEVAETYPVDGNIEETLRWVEVDPEARTAFAVARERERSNPRKGVLDVLTSDDD